MYKCMYNEGKGHGFLGYVFFYMKMFFERYRSRKSTSKMFNLLRLAVIVILSMLTQHLLVGGAFDDVTRSK